MGGSGWQRRTEHANDRADERPARTGRIMWKKTPSVADGIYRIADTFALSFRYNIADRFVHTDILFRTRILLPTI